MLVRPTPHSVSSCLTCSIFTRDTNVVLNLSFYGITGSSGLLKEGVQCMLVKFMARKEAWLKLRRSSHTQDSQMLLRSDP